MQGSDTIGLNDEQTVKEKIFNERIADIPTPNQTYEQRQLYYHTNKFLPLKQQGIIGLLEPKVVIITMIF